MLRKRAVKYVDDNAETLMVTIGEDAVRDYPTQMLDESTWGGAVEIDVFSQIYQCQITVFDVETRREEVFGRERKGCIRAFLLFVGGNHYDLLVWVPGQAKVKDVVLFSVHDETSVRRARRAAAKIAKTDQWYIDGKLKNVNILRQTSWAD